MKEEKIKQIQLATRSTNTGTDKLESSLIIEDGDSRNENGDDTKDTAKQPMLTRKGSKKVN